MPSINYGAGAYDRTDGNFPPLVLINMFVEKAKTSENQIALLSRPGLAEYASRGLSSIDGIFSKPDVFSSDIFVVSGGGLYRGATLLGAIAGTGPVKWANSGTEIVVTRGTTAYSYNGTNLAAIAFPDSANVTSVTFIGSLFVFARADSGKFYWSAALDARTIDALDFATAERSADNLYDLQALGDNLWLFGKDSIEAWAHTGEADLPFTRIEQVAPTKGINSTGALVEADNSLIFAGSEGVVYRISDVPARISDHWLEAKISDSASVSLFTFKFEGHEFVCIRMDDETFAIDMATQEWCEFQTAQGNWIAQCSAMVGADAYFGHSSTNQVLTFSGWADLSAALERRFTAAVPLDQPTSIDRLKLWVNSGETELLSGQGSDPVIEMRGSRDAGRTWRSYDPASLGAEGRYRTVPTWRRLGQFDFPGALLEFRVTDPVPFRLSAVKANDPDGGRQRVP
jgi:hypothetical protein